MLSPSKNSCSSRSRVHRKLHNAQTAGVLAYGLLLFIFICGRCPVLHAQTGNTSYQISSAESSILFTARHMGFLEVDGMFQQFEGKISLPEDALFPEQVTGYLNIVTESVNTEQKLRDKSLKSDSFFNTEKYPSIVVKLSGIRQQNLMLQAQISVEIMGNVNQLAAPLEITFSSPDSSQIILKGILNISRKELGLRFDSSMDTLIGDEVTVSYNFKAIRN